MAQAKEHRRKNQSVGIQAVLESEQVFSSNSNSSSANRSKKVLNSEENINMGQNESLNSSCDMVMTQMAICGEKVNDIDNFNVPNTKLHVPSIIFGRKSPTRSHSMEPVLLSVTTV